MLSLGDCRDKGKSAEEDLTVLLINKQRRHQLQPSYPVLAFVSGGEGTMRATVTTCSQQCAQPCWKAARLKPSSPEMVKMWKSPSSRGIRDASHASVTRISTSHRDHVLNGLGLQVETRAIKALEMTLEREWQRG